MKKKQIQDVNFQRLFILNPTSLCSDFKDCEEKGYRRLTAGQPVGLRYAGYVISLVEAVKKNGEVIELKGTFNLQEDLLRT